MTDDLVKWLRVQVDEDEQTALAATPGRWHWVDPGGKIKQALVADEYRDGRWSMVLPCANGDAFPSVYDAEHIARHGPARVLREVAAKRQIMLIHRRPPVGLWSSEPFEDCCDGCGYSGEFNAPNVRHIGDCPELRALAAVYADQPGFREEWR
jgi:hypothetical protein